MRRESSNEIKCNIRNSAVLQHTKTTISLTKQITGFYSIHFRQLWYCDNITRIFSSNKPAQQDSAEKGSLASNKASENDAKQAILSNVSAILKLATLAQRAMLIRSRDWPSSHQFFKFHKAKWIKEEQPKYQQKQLSAAKQRFLHNRCKNKYSNGK